MGTLIIFIAMILIAAVAAAVLISSISSIQSKALETGTATRQEIGTNINVIGLTADAGTELSEFSMTLRLSAGSDPVNLDDVILTVIGGDNDLESFPLNETTNGYLLEGNNHRAGYLVKGDVMTADFTLTNPVVEDERLQLTLIPKVGTPKTLYATTPTTFKEDGTIVIFP